MSAPSTIDFARLAPAAGSRLVVVGGCGGIGRAVTHAAVEIGLRVAVLDLDRSLAEQPPEPGVALSVALDATDEKRVAAAFNRVAQAFGGAIDGLVNLPGFANRFVSFDELSLAEFEETVAGSLTSTYLCCRAALPLLRRGAENTAGRSAIVNTASGLAVRVRSGFAPYSAAKAGVAALTKVIALEAAPLVRANTIAPGAVDTVFHEGGTGRPPDAPNARPRMNREAYGREIPLGRMADPVDMVGPILFLLGPGAGFVSGQMLHVNGAGVML